MSTTTKKVPSLARRRQAHILKTSAFLAYLNIPQPLLARTYEAQALLNKSAIRLQRQLKSHLTLCRAMFTNQESSS